MTETNKNIWAPWRMEYIHQLSEPKGSCFLCNAAANPDQDDNTFVLIRGTLCFVILNRFPYTGGHTLIAPYAHIGELEKTGDDVLLEMMKLTRDMKLLLQKSLGAEGFNIGINLNHCAGAGLPEHLHLHIVPRWSGDTNFMSVLGDVRVIPEAIEKTWKRLKEFMKEKS
jgi:ATP adenylyltransferase